MTGFVVQGHICAGNAERQATDLTSVEVSDDFDDDLVVFIRGLLSGNHYFSSGEVLQFVYLEWVVQAQKINSISSRVLSSTFHTFVY